MDDATRSLLDATVDALVAAGARPTAAGAEDARLVLGRRTVVLFADRPGAVLLDRLESPPRASPFAEFDLVVVGGGDEARAALERATTRSVSPSTLGFAHVEAPGRVWLGPGCSTSTAMALQSVGVAARASAPAPAPGPTVREIEAGRRDLDAFRLRLSTARSPATYALLAAVIAIYGLETLWGGTGGTTLLRMGAADHRLVAHGDFDRLLSYALLHASLVHLLTNALSLYWLGTLLEKLVGTRRFLVLFVVSALTGGVAVTFSSSAAVGMSGAVWGLLAACGALGFVGSAGLPEPLRKALRQSAMTNLGINLFISFLPGISLAGHIGGGVGGLLLVLLGIVRPPAADPRPATAPGEVGWSLASGLAVVALAGSFAVSLARGKPWDPNHLYVARAFAPPPG